MATQINVCVCVCVCVCVYASLRCMFVQRHAKDLGQTKSLDLSQTDLFSPRTADDGENADCVWALCAYVREKL